MFDFAFINKPLGWVLEFFSSLFGGNFAGAVFLFTLFINILLIPLNIKAQKSSVQQTRIKPKLDALKERCGDDKMKYNQEMQKLYQEEGVSMSGGCLPMLLRLVLMLCIYNVILSPLTYISGADKTQVNNVTAAISESLTEIKEKDKNEYKQLSQQLGWKEGGKNSRNELAIIRLIRSEDNTIKELLSKEGYAEIEKDLKAITKADKETAVDYNFITEKIDLTATPKFSLNIFNDAQWIWLMPIFSFICQNLSSLLSMRIQKRINPEAPSMVGMMLGMSVFSLIIGFTFPGGVTFYWACSSIVGGIIQIGVQYFYGPHKMLARERAKELVKQCDFEDSQLKKFNTQNND